ncbi:cysteine-rich RLK (RECEPTOR-like protein kinase) 26 [Euphorbia peplus]|nr:cysteine-rich RLK (RECEPTOR-like protein kinase) 26 [Euphorbia peplus]
MTSSLRFLFYFFCLLLEYVSAQMCRNNIGNYTANSTYRRNLESLLASLVSDTDIDYGFYNLSVGQLSDRVNAIALCRGDVTLDMCRNCIRDASRGILEACPNQKEAIAFSEYCTLRYSNRSIFGVRDTWATEIKWSPDNASNVNQFNWALQKLLGRLQSKAAAGSSTLKFATGNERAGFEKVFGLVQCSPDLSEQECQECLVASVRKIPFCCEGRLGGRISRPSCNVRFENYQFYHDISDESPIRFSMPPTSSSLLPKGTKKRTIIIVVISAGSVVTALILCITVYLKLERPSNRVENGITSSEALQFDFETIRASTDDFSAVNKLGQGGFGSVYKGALVDGQHIAVKRLSSGSSQGDVEFQNEVLLVAKLQHRNLVKLLGFCLEGNERLLIYEFVPNGSLDCFIFDPEKCKDLNWEKRFKIIGGIAKGLLYLHEDSRLRIIHRDMKASNILLDTEMNPKISDFGLARLLIMDQTHSNTTRVSGTFGYMAPEYMMHGRFSSKSDVFSFGVLILEILSGKRSSCFSNGENMEDLLTYAWRNWKAGTASNVIDPYLQNSLTSEMTKCIHIGLLCVQDNIAERPSMASIILMLNSHSYTLPLLPSQPSNFLDRSTRSNLSFLVSNSTETGDDQTAR